MTRDLIYEGKAKKIYSLQTEPENVCMEFKDSLTAFNALKKGSFENKGQINRDIASLIFSHLRDGGVESHWVRDEGAISMITKKVDIIPLEVVVRNTLAGSTAKKLGLEEGQKLAKPLVEFYFKNDALQDPFVSDDQIEILGIASAQDIKVLKEKALQVNSILLSLFSKTKIKLIDFKIEFGKTASGEILLADEITPDCCRLWDEVTNEKLDKDRFRRDLGQIKEKYEDVLGRLKSIKRGAK